jgi:hypothetical protein
MPWIFESDEEEYEFWKHECGQGGQMDDWGDEEGPDDEDLDDEDDEEEDDEEKPLVVDVAEVMVILNEVLAEPIGKRTAA